jgi:hypothetical protein
VVPQAEAGAERIGSVETDAMPISVDSDVGRARPTWEDMIMAYSTIPR